MTKNVKTRKEMAWYLSQVDESSVYFITHWNEKIGKARLCKMKIKTTHKHKKLLLVYYYSDILKGTYLSAVVDISNVEVYKLEKLHSGGQPTGNKKC